MKILAVTNGPIYKSLQKARSTRELWSASYFLSRIAEIEMKISLGSAKLLGPQLLSGDQTNQRAGAACYPERVYWEIPEFLSKEQLERLDNDVFDSICNVLCNTITSEKLRNYVRIYWVQMEFKPEDSNGESFLFEVNSVLDSFEYQDTWSHEEAVQIIPHLIGKKMGLNKNIRPVYRWRKESGQKYELLDYAEGLGRFPNMLEIATKSLAKSDKIQFFRDEVYGKTEKYLETEDDDNASDEEKINATQEAEACIIEIKRELGKIFREKDNYVCIVYGDGDHVKKFLSEQVKNDPGKFVQFSKDLNQFSIQATKEIVKYGGMPVYSGGDDFLFLCPVTKSGVSTFTGDTIVDLLAQLDQMIIKIIPALRMSFGVAIVHYKHPLDQGLKLAKDSLFNEVKKSNQKNHICFQLEKHSGSKMKFMLELDYNGNSLFSHLQKLIQRVLKLDDEYLKSVMYKLAKLRWVIETIYKLPEKTDVQKNMLRNMFNNNFNEEVHEEYREPEDAYDEMKLFGLLRIIINEIYKKNASRDEEYKHFALYSLLKFCESFIAEDHGD